MNKLLIVRHGQTDWNVLSLFQGSIDIPLNENGIKQVNELKKLIDVDSIDLCICSPLKRAKETADIILSSNKEIIYDDRLVERGLGKYEGMPVDMSIIEKIWDYDLNYNLDGIESIKDGLNRADEFIKYINNNYKDKTILIVSHAAFIKCLYYSLTGYDESTNFLSFVPKNASVFEYVIE